MATLMAVPTKEGLSILNSELSKKATRFCLIGSTSYANKTLDNLLTRDDLVYSNIDKYVFHLDGVESQYFDENGVLTFQVIVPVETDFKNYMYAVAIVTDDNKLVVLTKTPKIVPIEGVGGTFVVKTAVKGEVSQMVFKKGEYITWNEAEALFMTPQMANLALMTTIGDKMIQDEIKQIDHTTYIVCDSSGDCDIGTKIDLTSKLK